MSSVKLSFFSSLLAGLLLCGCSSSESGITEKDRLSPTEEEIVISHVRRFVKRAKKMNLTEAERELIQTVKPSMYVKYTGSKTGRLSLRWKLPNSRILLLQRSGNLLSSERADWTVRIISDKTGGKIPENFYGAHGEDISLPPQ
ncbi:MAG: hypothetical protein J5858_06900 [Lentisphaeria bacterium]|nr:hypothetical protein [Lentisphaeria bacterium]